MFKIVFGGKKTFRKMAYHSFKSSAQTPAKTLYNVPKKAYMTHLMRKEIFLRMERKSNSKIYTFACLFFFPKTDSL